MFWGDMNFWGMFNKPWYVYRNVQQWRSIASLLLIIHKMVFPLFYNGDICTRFSHTTSNRTDSQTICQTLGKLKFSFIVSRSAWTPLTIYSISEWAVRPVDLTPSNMGTVTGYVTHSTSNHGTTCLTCPRNLNLQHVVILWTNGGPVCYW